MSTFYRDDKVGQMLCIVAVIVYLVVKYGM